MQLQPNLKMPTIRKKIRSQKRVYSSFHMSLNIMCAKKLKFNCQVSTVSRVRNENDNTEKKIWGPPRLTKLKQNSKGQANITVEVKNLSS